MHHCVMKISVPAQFCKRLVRFKERSAAERVNGAVKDSYGGRFVRVRGHAKVLCHLMFGVLALAAEQLMRLVV